MAVSCQLSGKNDVDRHFAGSEHKVQPDIVIVAIVAWFFHQPIVDGYKPQYHGTLMYL
jgi:hypothetical protein